MATGSLAESSVAVPMGPSPHFQHLYEQYAELVYSTALRVTGNPADAEDVLQTVFLRLWKQGEPESSAVSVEAYLKRAATNAAIDVLRRRQWRAETSLEEVGASLVAESPSLLKHRLRQALSRLEPEDAELFVLKYVEGLSGKELARLYGIERATVGSRLFRIRQELRQALEGCPGEGKDVGGSS